MLSGDESLDKDFGTGQLIMPDSTHHPESATIEQGTKVESKESTQTPLYKIQSTRLVSDGEQAIREGTQSDVESKGSGKAGKKRLKKSIAGTTSKHSQLAIHEEEAHEEDNESFKSASSFEDSKEASDVRTE